MSEGVLTTSELRDALEDIAIRLDQAHIQARIYIVGGAALALADGYRDSTRDVDAIYSPSNEIENYAAQVARDRGLPENWLNNKVKGFVPFFRDDPGQRPIFTIGSVTITAASHEVLLAMKIGASRGRIDREDIRFLIRATGIKSKEEAIALYEEYFPEDPLTPRASPVLDSILGRSD